MNSKVYSEKLPTKGEATSALILRCALSMARRTGLEGLTIGAIADEMKMSKTGVFARFGSREKLLIEALKLYRVQFERAVFHPGLEEHAGLPRLTEVFMRWVQFEADDSGIGSIYISAAAEYENRSGAVRDVLVAMIKDWQAWLLHYIKTAIELGHLPAKLDAEMLVYEIYGLILGLHHDMRLLKLPGSAQRAMRSFNRLLEAGGGAQPGSIEAPHPKWWTVHVHWASLREQRHRAH
ncbi:TetR/AcrR family transcriptional regulator [Noviherbaspirillum saxi]|uniref:TetR/AcrR family transcriptional regulator n=1 Tax=Noviherbaspirillum saxi TaxID=2320863 RepID=A0A3A3FLY7_9BURK|nr:TetR family transcriptional regulator [Noviherbaspirillum saxi]RJF92542.1 TetR/AcrR family transcriptional regulator [Noviherbaspirillum saxi]